MHKRVIVTSIEELKKKDNCLSFTINRPKYDFTFEQECKDIQKLMKNIHADKLTNTPKDYYFN